MSITPPRSLAAIVLAVLAFAPRPARAQDADAAANAWAALARHIEIRQNTNVRRDIAQPAFVTLTNPDGGPLTMQVGVGVLTDLYSRAGFDVNALFDYQRNTALDAEQDFVKAGANGHWRALNLVEHGHAPLLTFRTNFARNGVSESHGWQTAAGYTHLFSGQHRWPMPNLPHRFGAASGTRAAALELIYFPYAGVEIDHTASAADAAAEGTTTRVLGQISVALYPLPRTDRSPLELLFTFTHRQDLDGPAGAIDDAHPLFSFETNYFPIQHRLGEIGFGLSYVNGEDPDEGFVDQAYWQFSLKFRLKRQ